MNTNIEYIHDFLESVKDDRSLYERILDDIEDGERLNNGDDKHTVYYLQLSDDTNSKEKDYWVKNIRKYTNFYVYAMLFNWNEQWTDDEIIKNRLESILNGFSNEIASEIATFNEEDNSKIPFIVLREMEFISDAFQWKNSQDIPAFTEAQKQNIEEYRQNYSRYIKLINGEDQEDIAKNIDKYLSYCMTIDDAYKSTDCLTSFIMHLSGTGDDTVNYDTMLKSIPAESWGIDTIRQSLLKGGMNIPADIIKLTIYSISRFTQNDTIPENDVEKREAFVKELLDRASDDYTILMKNHTKLEIVDLLKLSSYIRDYLSTNTNVIISCNEDPLLSEKRKHLLDDIRKFQMDVIEEHTKSDKESAEEQYKKVIDFSKAKEDLVAMIEEEQSLNLFEEISDPKIYQSIGLCKTHEQTLSRVADSCRNGKYKVLIMGDFQSGKSTTVDALCDGRHVCAIGKGIATSAVLVTVTYSAEEHTLIHWRTKNQFTSIFNRIKPYIQAYNWDDFDLDNQSSRNQLKAEIHKLRNIKSSNLGQGDTKFLMLCDFVLHYYDTSELKQKKQSLRTIVDTSEITKFPDKGETIWKKKGTAGFKIDEVLFIFIESVDCFVSSETLRNLNCTIIDSPGLFNSAYDTMVTEQAMVEAHAIMYVLPFEKAMREDVCASLYKIKNDYPDVHRKLFVVNNSRPGRKTVYESNCETIKTMFGADKMVPRYDAKLSYLLQVKKLYDIGKASITDYRHLLTVEIEDYDTEGERIYDNFDDAWNEHISVYERILKGNYENGLQKSGFLNVIIALKTFIEINESYAVIVSNGIAPMNQELSGIKNSIYRSYIEPYISSQEEISTRWENRIKKAKEFQNLVSESIRKAVFDGGNSLIDRMALEEYKKLFTGDFYTELSREIAGVIYDNKKSLLSIKSLFKKNEFKAKVVAKLKPLIEKKVVEVVGGKIKYLNSLIEGKQDATVTNMFAPAIDNVELKLLQNWHELFNDDKFKMQDYLVLAKDLSPAQNINYSDSPYDASVLSENTDRLILFQGFVSEISTIIAGVVSMIAGYIALVFTDPTGISEAIAFAIAGVLGIMGGFVAIIAPNWAREKSVNKLGELLIPKVKTNEVETGFNSLVKKQLESIVLKYITAQKIDIQKMNNERDLAMQPTANREVLCFKAVEETKRLNEQLIVYSDYKQKHLATHETI